MFYSGINLENYSCKGHYKNKVIRESHIKIFLFLKFGKLKQKYVTVAYCYRIVKKNYDLNHGSLSLSLSVCVWGGVSGIYVYEFQK